MANFILNALLQDALEATILGIEHCDDAKWLEKRIIKFDNIQKAVADTQKLVRRELKRYIDKKGMLLQSLRYNKYEVKLTIKVPGIPQFGRVDIQPTALQGMAVRMSTMLKDVATDNSVSAVQYGSYSYSTWTPLIDSHCFELHVSSLRQLCDFLKVPTRTSVIKAVTAVVDCLFEINRDFSKAVNDFWENEHALKKLVLDTECVTRRYNFIEVDATGFSKLLFGGVEDGDNN